MNFFLDPFILMIPNKSDIHKVDKSGSSPTQWQSFAENLYTWASEIARGEHDFWLSLYVYDALIKVKRYPTWENLQRLSMYLDDSTPYDIRTIYTSCERALTEPSFLEELAKDEEHEVLPNTTVVIPKTILQCLPTEVSVALTKALTHSALVSHQGMNVIFSEMRFASVEKIITEKLNENEEEIDVNCSYGKIKTSTISKKELQIEIAAYDLLLNADEVIEETWPIVLSPEQIKDVKDDILSFWEDTDRAIEWAKRQVEKNGLSTDEMVAYSVGKKFNESIRNTHMDNDKDAFKALFIKIARCLCGDISRSKVSKGTPNHPIRKGRKSHEQVTRPKDGATAWRLRIQGEWRLHYWLLDDGSIELANVEKSHSMRIES